MDNPLHLLAFAAIVAFAMVTEAALGFGATVIAVTLGAHLVALDVLLPALVPVNFLLSSGVLLRHRAHVDRPLLLRRVLPAMAPGVAVGLVLWRLGTGKALLLALALFVAGLAALELTRELRGRASAVRALPRPIEAALLACAGVAHGLYGTGGPLVVYAAGRALPDKARFRATLTALWWVLGAVLLVQYAAQGLIGVRSGQVSLALLPALGVGLWLGDRVHGRVDERSFRRLVWTLLLAAALALLARSL